MKFTPERVGACPHGYLGFCTTCNGGTAMKFGDAQVMMKEHGLRVARECYPAGISIRLAGDAAVLNPDGSQTDCDPFYLIEYREPHPARVCVPWVVSHGDLLADDWKVVV